MTAASSLTVVCGHHCGTQNGLTGHCWCEECHDGEPRWSTVQADGCVDYYDLQWRCTGGEAGGPDHEPGSHIDLRPDDVREADPDGW